MLFLSIVVSENLAANAREPSTTRGNLPLFRRSGILQVSEHVCGLAFLRRLGRRRSCNHPRRHTEGFGVPFGQDQGNGPASRKGIVQGCILVVQPRRLRPANVGGVLRPHADVGERFFRRRRRAIFPCAGRSQRYSYAPAGVSCAKAWGSFLVWALTAGELWAPQRRLPSAAATHAPPSSDPSSPGLAFRAPP